MARHNDLGKAGEEIAARWLTEKGFVILQRNWRHRRSEVDIIAIRQKTYHFIEIKSGRGKAYGSPEDRVGKTKLQHMMRVAAHWQYLHPIPSGYRVQYDVLAIQWLNEGPEYFLFEDVSV